MVEQPIQSASESSESPSSHDTDVVMEKTKDQFDYERRVAKKGLTIWVLVGVVAFLFFGYMAFTWVSNNLF